MGKRHALNAQSSASPVTTGAGGMRSAEGSPTPGMFPPPESMRPTLVGCRYMVSAGHPLVAQVAARVLERGGNAIDAGVAAGIAANVVQVDMANFGGIAPILVRVAGSDDVWSIGGVGTWGRDVSVEAFHNRLGDDMPLGAPVAIVPAAPDAWITALARFGTWPFADVAAAAIEIAREGIVVDGRTATALRILGQGFMQWESTRSIYWAQGREPRVGDRLRQPQLARLLQAMADAESGSNRAEALESVRRSFYEGDVARHIVTFIRANGGWLTLEDLVTFRCEVALAPARSYHGHKVHVTGTWSQGPALLQALAILEGVNLQDLGHNSAAYIHYVAEAIKLAFSDRERHYGDPRFVDVNLEWLLSDAHASELRARIAAHAALPNLPTMPRGAQLPDPQGHMPGGVRRRGDTTSLCVLDEKGNAFSATPSDTLDGGPIVPDLGIIISPRGVQSRLDPAHPSVLAPGKRPRVTPAPALIITPGSGTDAMVWPLNCPGGDVIVQAMLQVFLNRVHFAMTPQQAVEAPRIASFSYPDSFFPHTEVHGRLSVEGRIDEAVRADLAERGHHVWVWPDYEFDAGGVTLALDLEPPSQQGRTLAAAADPRRICYALGR